MASGDGYLVVPNWTKFQHYGNRRAQWIKNYTALLHHDDYMDLPLAARGLLHGVWLLTAEAGNGRVPNSIQYLSRRLAVTNQGDASHLRKNLELLIQAGFLEVSASKALAERYRQSTDNSGVPPLLPVQNKRRASKNPPARQDLSSDNGTQPHAGDDPEDKPLTKAEARRALAAIQAKALQPLDPDDEEL